MVTVGSIRSHRQFGNRGASAHQQIAGHGADPRSLVEHDLFRKTGTHFSGTCSHNAGGPVARGRREAELGSFGGEASFQRRGSRSATAIPARRKPAATEAAPFWRARTEASTRIGMRAPRGSATASTCVEGFCAYPVRKNAYAAAAGPFENSRAPVSMNLRVSSAKCLPSSASLWK